MDDEQPGEYRKLAVKQFPPRSLRETAEGAYWKRFRAPVLAQQVVWTADQAACRHKTLSHFAQVGAVSHVDVCEAWPHHCAASSATRVRLWLTRALSPSESVTPGPLQVLLYDGVTRQPRAQITRFKDKAYGARFRSDGQLIVAGGETGIVQVGAGLTAARWVVQADAHTACRCLTPPAGACCAS